MSFQIKPLGFGKVAVLHNQKQVKMFSGNTASLDARSYVENQYKSSEPEARTGRVTSEDVGNAYEDMQVERQISEVLSKDASAGEWIKDFLASDNPQFAGKSAAKRKEMALAAYYAKQRNESVSIIEPVDEARSYSGSRGFRGVGGARYREDDEGYYRKPSKYLEPERHVIDTENDPQAKIEVGHKVRSYDYGGTNKEHYIDGTVAKITPTHFVVDASKMMRYGKEREIPEDMKRFRIPRGKGEFSGEYAVHKLDEAALGNEAEFKVTQAGKRWKKADKQDKQGVPEKSLEFADKPTNEARLAMPLKGHDYHKKTDAELHYICKDAGEAAQAMKGHNPQAEAKYLDQVNDASTVLHYRSKGGRQLSDITQKAESFADLMFDGEIVYEKVDCSSVKDCSYDDYVKAAMKKVGIKSLAELPEKERKDFMAEVDAAFKGKNEAYVVEAFLRSDIEAKIAAHQKHGNRVDDVRHSIRNGQPYSEFIVTTPDGSRKKYVFHGDTQRLETLG